MYEKPFKLDIITPARVVYADEAVSVSAPGVLGGFQVLHNHAPFLSALEVGRIKVKTARGEDLLYATSGGVLEVSNNHVVVLADTAERPEEIDVERARVAKERAEERLRSRDENLDPDRARLALVRALNRLRIAGRA